MTLDYPGGPNKSQGSSESGRWTGESERHGQRKQPQRNAVAGFTRTEWATTQTRPGNHKETHCLPEPPEGNTAWVTP